MERETGFEPATSTLARLHSTTELFPLTNCRLEDITETAEKTQPEIAVEPILRKELKCVPQKSCFLAENRHDVEPIGIGAEIVVRDELLCRATQFLLFLPVDEFPRFPEVCRTPGFHFNEDKRFLFQRDDIQLAGTTPMPPSQDVETLPQKETTRNPFPSAALEQVRRNHG
jgi:hypothetical protein